MVRDPMEELRVPKRRTEVELVLHGGDVRRVEVFLSEFAATHIGAERLSDLLNGAGNFFPAMDAAAKALLFINRRAVMLARVSAEVEAEVEEQNTIPTENEVQVTLADAQTLEGLVTYVLPPDHSRLTDFLNEGPPFFRLLEKDKATLVNKRYVSHVQIQER